MSKYLIDIVTGYDTKAIGWVVSLMIAMGMGNIVLNAITSRATVLISTKAVSYTHLDVYKRQLYEMLEDIRLTDEYKAIKLISFFAAVDTIGSS